MPLHLCVGMRDVDMGNNLRTCPNSDLHTTLAHVVSLRLEPLYKIGLETHLPLGGWPPGPNTSWNRIRTQLMLHK